MMPAARAASIFPSPGPRGKYGEKRTQQHSRTDAVCMTAIKSVRLFYPVQVSPILLLGFQTVPPLTILPIPQSSCPINLLCRKIASRIVPFYNEGALYDDVMPLIQLYRATRKEVFAIAHEIAAKPEKRTYSVDEVREILGIGRRKAYELCHSDQFKVIHVGRVLRVSKASFDFWLDCSNQNGGK